MANGHICGKFSTGKISFPKKIFYFFHFGLYCSVSEADWGMCEESFNLGKMRVFFYKILYEISVFSAVGHFYFLTLKCDENIAIHWLCEDYET